MSTLNTARSTEHSISPQLCGPALYDLSILRAPQIQTTNDLNLAINLFNPNLNQILSSFHDQTEASQAYTAREIIRFGFLQAVANRTWAEHFGVLPEHVDTLIKRCKIDPTSLFSTECSTYISNLVLYLSSDTPPVLKSRDGRHRIKTFPCEFRELSGSMARAIKHVDMDSARIFAMHLPAEDMRAVLSSSDRPINSESMHVTGAFAYIRYYTNSPVVTKPVVDDYRKIEIVEIQSDFFSSIGDRTLRERYKHWQELLLTAFEVYLSPLTDERSHVHTAFLKNLLKLVPEDKDLLDGMIQEHYINTKLQESGEIIIPLPKIVRDRWSSAVDGFTGELSSGKAERIYGAVPDKLDYLISQSVSPRFTEVDLDGQVVTNLLCWRKAIRKLDCIEPDAFTAQLAPHLHYNDNFKPYNPSSVAKSFAPPWFIADLYNHGYATSFPVMSDTIRSIAKLPGCVIVPIEPIPVRSIRGLTDSMHQALLRQSEQPNIALACSKIAPEFSAFSQGIENGLPEDWWNFNSHSDNGITATFLGIKDQKRHPSLRIWESGTNRPPDICIGFKGAGITIRNPNDFKLTLHSTDSSTPNTYPILPRSDESVSCDSHLYWGGLRLDHAIDEYRNAVGITYLLDTVGENPIDRIALPLNVARLNSVPLFTDGGLSWMSTRDYLNKVLVKGGSKLSANRFSADFLHQNGWNTGDHLAVFVSASHSDVRISQVVNRVMSRTNESVKNIFACKNEIDSALRYLFAVNGATLIIPEKLSILPQNDQIGPPQYQHYVNELLKYNQQAGHEIYQRISRNLISTIGLIHGAGGNLGGGNIGHLESSPKLQIGAFGGGASTIRNVDCCGAIHDLDSEVFLPWVEPLHKLSKWQEEMQSFDTFFMAETLYWFRAMLIGIPLAPTDRLSHFSLVKPENKFSLFSSGAEFTSPLPREYLTNSQANYSAFMNDRAQLRLPTIEEFQSTNTKSGKQRYYASSMPLSELAISIEELQLLNDEHSRGRSWWKSQLHTKRTS